MPKLEKRSVFMMRTESFACPVYTEVRPLPATQLKCEAQFRSRRNTRKTQTKAQTANYRFSTPCLYALDVLHGDVFSPCQLPVSDVVETEVRIQKTGGSRDSKWRRQNPAVGDGVGRSSMEASETGSWFAPVAFALARARASG
jgi:hypothetical protein